jgi:hypothetical protein
MAEVRSANVVDGARGRFVAGKSALHFETARLPRSADAQTDHPERDYDVALRLLDGEGQTLLIMTEGDVVPDQWKLEVSEAVPGRAADPAVLKMAAKAARRVGALQLGADLQVEKSLLASQLASLANIADQMPQSSVEANSAQAAAAVTYYQQSIDSYWKSAFFNGSPFDHTATATYRYRYSGGWSWLPPAIINCNHGTCPLDPAMTYYKTYTGPTTTSSLVYPQVCSGPYGLPHVCNNDTLLQQKNVYYNSTYNTWLDSACTYTELWRP